MDKYNINRTVLLLQIIISTFFLGGCTYFIFPKYDGNKELIGFYYTISTVTSFLICMIVEFILRHFYSYLENRAKNKAINSKPTDKHEEYRCKLEEEQRNKYIMGFKQRYDKNN
ncbi:hypothetical protein KMU_05930 [Proteus vulgaris]|nr:hypothetical protein KMU_05930 [Proteus vulgaris]